MSRNTTADVRPRGPRRADARSVKPAYPVNPVCSRRAALKAALGLVGAAALIANPVEAFATPSASKETLDALAAAEARLDEVQQELDDLSNEFQELSRKQDETLQQIEDVQVKIDETQAKIEQKEQELADKQAVLARRVAASYKNGGTSALALLLSSDTFEQLISNAYYVDKINESDQKAIDEVQRIRAELDAEKSDLEQQKSALEDLKDQQAQQLADMQAKQAEVEEVLNGLSDDVKELMEKRDAEILEAARAEEEARRQAELAAKQAATGSVALPERGGGQDYDAASGAQKRIVNACYATPSPGNSLCAMWVSQVFSRAGFSYPNGNANDMYSTWCSSSSKSNLQVGMIIAVSTHAHTSAGRIWGHVGIYIGSGTVMDNVGYIRSINVDEWISYYGTTVTPRWGWVFGTDLSQMS